MSLRKILFWIHLTVGCLAGAVVFVMAVTGVLLAYQHQITAWADRDMHSTSQSAAGERLPMEALLAEVSARNSGGVPTAVTLRSDPKAPAEVSFGREHVFLVDGSNGKVLGEASPRVRWFFQTVENWHRWLGTSNEHRAGGRAVTGACNLGFLFLVVSGPFLWLPRKWSTQSVKAITLFRGGLSGRARDFNWHNVTGIWCLLPLFVIVLSGVVMSYPWANNLLYQVTGSELPAQGGGGQRGSATAEAGQRRHRDQPGEDRAAAPSPIGSDAAWIRAQQQVPGWRTLTLRLTPNGRGPLVFTIDTGNGGRPDQRSQLTLDRRTAEVIKWEPFSSYNAGRRLRSWLRFLHTGEAFGFAGETIAGIASAGAALLTWTGLWLAVRRWLRSRKRTAAAPELATVEAASR